MLLAMYVCQPASEFRKARTLGLVQQNIEGYSYAQISFTLSEFYNHVPRNPLGGTSRHLPLLDVIRNGVYYCYRLDDVVRIAGYHY